MNGLSKFKLTLEKLQKIGRAILAQVRSHLPSSFEGKLSDPLLTGIILSASAFLIYDWDFFDIIQLTA